MIMRRSAVLLLAALVGACGTHADSRPPAATGTGARAGRAAAGPVAVAPPRVSPRARADSDTADDDLVARPARPARVRPAPAPESVRGLYVSRAVAAGPDMWKLISLARRTEVNAVVIDVKDDRGLVLAPSTVGLAHAVGADTGHLLPVARLHALLDSLRAHRIFAIGRIVVGRDPLLAAHRPEWAVRRRADDQPWRDSTGALWLDPAHREVWAYAADLASEAVARGFSEILFDAVRFPDEPGMQRDAQFALDAGQDRAGVLRRRLSYLQYRTDPLGVPVAVTVPAAALTGGDPGGEGWDVVAGAADVLVPIMFAPDAPGAPQRPYDVLVRALADAKRRNAGVRGAAAIMPWYQDPGTGSVATDSALVREEIRAGYENGLRSWLLWDPAGEYTEAALHEPARRDTAARAARGTAHRHP